MRAFGFILIETIYVLSTPNKLNILLNIKESIVIELQLDLNDNNNDKHCNDNVCDIENIWRNMETLYVSPKEIEPNNNKPFKPIYAILNAIQQTSISISDTINITGDKS